MKNLKVLKEGNIYSVKEVHENLYQLVIVVKEFETKEEAMDAMLEAVMEDDIE